MKNRTIAATLNFFAPGVGLWYLGKHRWAVGNLIAATGLVLSAGGVESIAERIHYVILGVAAGSAGLAHAVGGDFDKAARTQPASRADQPQSEHPPQIHATPSTEKET
ncbi:MAG: hypothetical protein HQ518_01165 [Rhodopirellula sp.]|nr:hypothetical protein [Rhodopirellula sp.]